MAKSSEEFTFYFNVEAIDEVKWNSVVDNSNIYLSLPYLSALEKGLQSDVKLIYILALDASKKAIVAGVFQIVKFTSKQKFDGNIVYKILQDCRKTDDSVSINCLVCGNMFATGENGIAFSDKISKKQAVEIMANAAKKLSKNSKFEDSFDVILFKEFWNNHEYLSAFEEEKFRPFQIDVNMVLNLSKSWKSLEDYLNTMKAKYRTKANSAFKKAEKLEIKTLSSTEIEESLEQLDRLFINVLEKAHYSYGEEYVKCLPYLKSNLGENFICRAIILENEILGFSAAIINNNCLEANYVGIDYEYNTKYAIYERLLYDYVEQAINLKVNQLHLGRTSELIKSALGAKPEQMTLFVKHRSKVKDIFIKPFLKTIKPAQFELRKPFKEIVSEA